MNTSTIEARRMPAKRLGVFALGIAVACAGLFGMAASKADAAGNQGRSATQAGFQMQLNNGLLNLGAAFVGKEVLPAPAKLGTTTLPNWWDIVDSIAATAGAPTTTNVCTSATSAVGGNPNVAFPCGSNPSYALIRGVNNGASNWNPTTGAITLNQVLPTGGGAPWAEAFNADVRFPIMQVPSPTTGSPVPITVAATSAVTGTYDSTPGALTLTPPTDNGLQARVLVGLGIPASAGGPQPFTYCSVPLPGLTLSTGAGSGSKAFAGTPFTAGLGGLGALQGTYTVADNSTSVTQAGLSGAGAVAATQALAQCASAVDLVIKGDGGLWFGNRIDPPVCAEGQIGTYPDCTDPKADITAVKVTGGAKVKKGKKLSLTVKVTNSGTADESVKVKLWSSSAGVASVTGSATVEAPAGGTGTKKVTVKGKKKGKATISATNGAKTGSKKVTVK
ncbi:MAG: hypothetical protein ACKOQ5_01150 [Solirubrobacterales bacterium]